MKTGTKLDVPLIFTFGHRICQKGYPWNIEIVRVFSGCGKYEKMVHNKLKPFMISGENKKLTEWFEIQEDELIKQIEDILIVELF